MKKLIALAAGLAFALSACDAAAPEATDPTAPETITAEAATVTVTEDAEAETVTETVTETATETVTVEAEPVEEEAVEEEAEDTSSVSGTTASGTRDDPVPLGETMVLSNGTDDIEVTVNWTNFDATGLIAQENQFNDPPQEGFTYLLAEVTLAYYGSEVLSPYFDTDITYLAADGRTFDEAMVVLPNDMSNVGDLYDGGVATGNFGFEVPLDAQEGVLIIEMGWDGTPVFFAAN